MATTTQPSAVPPTWINQYIESFRSGEAHAFLIHGDVDGTAYEAVAQRGLLLAALAQKREVVAVYHRAGGIELYNADEQITIGERVTTRRQRALDLAGLGVATPQSANNPMAAALAQLGQTAPSSDPLAGARRPLDALDLLDKLLRADAGRGKVAVILDYADTLCPPADKAAMSPDDRTLLVTLLTWAKDSRIARANNPIFLLSRMLTDLHPDLRTAGSGYKVIEMALPDRRERGVYLDWYLARRREQQKAIALLDNLTVAEISNLTAGLSLRNIEDVLLLAAQTSGLTRTLLKARKDEIIRAEQAEVAEMIEPLPNGFDDLYGADYIKTWAEDEIIAPVRAGRLSDVPKGILLVGPPGTGKTYFARALAKSIGFNAVALKSENILDGIVGQSERKLRQFFAFCRSLAPVLVFFDEIDQSDMSRRGNGSGNPVAANLFNQMLQFMSDETMRGKVIMVFASNRPDLLDDAFKRSGRIDAIIPILLPDADQRQAILTGIAMSLGAPLGAGVADELAAQTDKYNAADLREVISKARKRAIRGGRTQIAGDDARQALRFYRPSGVSKANWYTLLAIDACNDAEHLPPQYADMLNNREALRADIRTTAQDGNERNERDW